ncbi:MAG: isocitrate lyase/phosphoenolpyruvate mutase family protein [Xanthomonadales bacterium PRO6]|nr:2-methylisocitrate lyase [Xanthomonadales bacterium]MCE7931166.1 isocitrate lyase/phosphoenolpyruvate mutase family protein [Xanthomonadales bacterium PRO6]
MNRADQHERARRFRALHDGSRVLLLPNAWDAGSACMLSELGFSAIATTSGGMAWSLGYADGERTPLPLVLDTVSRMARATPLPLTVDFEAGFGDDPRAVAESVRAVIEAGAVGINLEDGIRHQMLRPIDAAAARIAAAREAALACGLPLFINARIDAWLVDGSACPDEREDERVDETLRRARAYLTAGADGIYPIAATRPGTIMGLCRAIHAPVNVGARPGLPTLAELARLGVARVSTATRLAAVALAAAREAARRMLAGGGFDSLDAGFGYPDMQRLLARPIDSMN